MMKWTFQYAYWSTATVTVRAWTEDQARAKAAAEMDRRYAKRDKEPPVGWTLRLIRAVE